MGFDPSDGEDMVRRVLHVLQPWHSTHGSRYQSSTRDQTLPDQETQCLSIHRESLTIYDKVDQHQEYQPKILKLLEETYLTSHPEHRGDEGKPFSRIWHVSRKS